MEDVVAKMHAFVADSDGVYHFSGAYDDHKGSQATLYCKDQLHAVVAEEIQLTEPLTSTHLLI